jgi:Icc-related predicted phosphoesterase
MDVAWLLDEIRSIQNENQQVQSESEKISILVVTHHAPCLKRTSGPQHENNPWRFAFGTDILRNITDTNGIKAWVFGHTHYTTEFRERGVRVVSNQRGYVLPWKTEKVKDEFDVGKVIQV